MRLLTCPTFAFTHGTSPSPSPPTHRPRLSRPSQRHQGLDIITRSGDPLFIPPPSLARPHKAERGRGRGSALPKLTHARPAAPWPTMRQHKKYGITVRAALHTGGALDETQWLIAEAICAPGVCVCFKLSLSYIFSFFCQSAPPPLPVLSLSSSPPLSPRE